VIVRPADTTFPLDVRDVTVRFGGNLALDNVSVHVETGRVTGLIGPNGAGKTTLFNVVTGLLAASNGRVTLAGRDVTKMPPYKRARCGLARTFQRLELFTSLSVHDNIRVAGEFRNRWARPRIDPVAEADRLIELLALDEYAERGVSEIPTGMARRVELGRALMTKPKVLLLDEPASGQDEHETEEFGRLLTRLAEAGIAIFLVEHDVQLVVSTCSYIYALDFGEIIAEGAPDVIRNNRAVVDAYLGESLT
jgi:branched-chain amino acid transport system ATP-binding protein